VHVNELVRQLINDSFILIRQDALHSVKSSLKFIFYNFLQRSLLCVIFPSGKKHFTKDTQNIIEEKVKNWGNEKAQWEDLHQ